MDATKKQPRRTLLRGVLVGAAGAASGAVLNACTDSPTAGPAPSSAAPRGSTAGGSTVLLAYFSRAGENYFNGGRRRLTVGNTEVVAGMISRLTGCDVHRIEAADPYPGRRRATRRRGLATPHRPAHPLTHRRTAPAARRPAQG
jgi:hypothetical protein